MPRPLLAGLVALGLLASCASETLVLFTLEIEGAVDAGDAVELIALSHPSVAARSLPFPPQRKQRVGYYMRGVTGEAVVRAQVKRGACVLGEGRLATGPLVAGQSREAGLLLVQPVSVPCGGGEAPGALAAGEVHDGPAPGDLDVQGQGESLTAHWSGFPADVTRYEYQISAAADCTGTPLSGPRTLAAAVTTHTEIGLALTERRVYSCVRAFDASGRRSRWAASDGVVVDLTPPAVVELRPADGGKDVERHAAIVARFSEPVQPAAAVGGLLISVGERRIAAKLTLDAGGTTLTAQPDAPLPMLGTITAMVTSEVKDGAGHAVPLTRATFTTADGAFGEPILLETWDNPAGQRTRPSLAADASGRVAVAWERIEAAPSTRSDIALFRHDRIGGKLPRLEMPRFGAGRAMAPVVVMAGARGDGFVSYEQIDLGMPSPIASVWGHAFNYVTGWRLWAKLDLEEMPAGATSLGVSVQGDAVERAIVAWTTINTTSNVSTLRALEAAATGEWQRTPTLLDTTTTFAGINSRVVFDPAGNAWVVWIEVATPAGGAASLRSPGQISARQYRRNLGWDAVVRLSQPQPDVSVGFDAEVDGAGNLLVVWAQGAAEADDRTVYAAYYDAADRSWRRPAPSKLRAARTEFGPFVAMNRAGSAIACWIGAARELVLQRLDHGFWLEPARQRTDPLAVADVGIDDLGNALVMWAVGFPPTDLLFARDRPGGGPFSPVKLNREGAYNSPEFVVLPDGRAFATWVEGVPNRLMLGRFE